MRDDDFETGLVELNITGGVDFAVSDRVSFGAAVNWAGDATSFGDALQDAVTLTLVTSLASELGDTSLQPYVSLGLSEAAPDTALGVNWSKTW